jgi:hypothetical protein
VTVLVAIALSVVGEARGQLRWTWLRHAAISVERASGEVGTIAGRSRGFGPRVSWSAIPTMEIVNVGKRGSVDGLLIAIVGVIALAVVFDFTNGFHDAANSVATVVATRALPARWAP